MQEDEEADYLGDEDDCESADGGSEEEEIMEAIERKQWSWKNLLCLANVYANKVSRNIKKERLHQLVLVDWEAPWEGTWERLEDVDGDKKARSVNRLRNQAYYIILGEADKHCPHEDAHGSTNVPAKFQNFEGFPLLPERSTEGAIVASWKAMLLANPYLLHNEPPGVEPFPSSNVSAAGSTSPLVNDEFAEEDVDDVDAAVPMVESPEKEQLNEDGFDGSCSGIRGDEPLQETKRARRSPAKSLNFDAETGLGVCSNAEAVTAETAPSTSSRPSGNRRGSISIAQRAAASLEEALKHTDELVGHSLRHAQQACKDFVASSFTRRGIIAQDTFAVRFGEVTVRATDGQQRELDHADVYCSFAMVAHVVCLKCATSRNKIGTLRWMVDVQGDGVVCGLDCKVQLAQLTQAITRATDHRVICKGKLIEESMSSSNSGTNSSLSSSARSRTSASRSRSAKASKSPSASELALALKTSFIVAESRERESASRIGAKANVERALGDILKFSSAIAASPFVRKWFLVGPKQELADGDSNVKSLYTLRLNMDFFRDHNDALAALERDTLQLSKRLLDAMSIAQPRLKQNEAVDLSPSSVVDYGGVGDFSRPLVDEQTLSVKNGRAAPRQMLAASTIQSKAVSILALFRYFFGPSCVPRGAAVPACGAVLGLVNRQLILLSNAASNQSHLLKEIAMASNVPLLVKLHVQIRDVYESISSTFAADLSFLLQDVSVTCNDADGCFKIDGAEAALTRVDERCRLLFQCAYVKELVSAFQLCTIYGRGAGRPQQMHNSMLLSYGLNPDQMSRLYARMVTFLTYTDRTTMFGLVTMRDKTQTSKIPLQEPVSYPVQVLVHLIALHHWSLRRRFELSSFPVLDAALNMGPIISAGLAIPLCTAVDPNDSMRLICFDGPQLEEAMMHMVEYGPCFEKWVIWDGTCKVPCWRLNRLRSDYNQRVIEFAMPAWLRSIGALRTASAAFQAYALAEDPELFSLLAPLNRHCPDMRKSKHYAAVQPMIEALHALRSYGAYVGITARSYPPAPGMTAVAAALKKLQVAMPELSANQLHSLDVAAFILFPEIASCDAKLCDAAHAVWSRIDGLLKDSIASVSPFTPLDGPLRLPSYMTLCGIPCVVTHDVPVSSDCRCCCTKLHVTEVLHVKDVLRMGRLEILEDETKQRCFELLGHSHLLRLSNPDASDRRFHQGEDILTEMGHVSFLHCPNHSKCGDGKKSIDQCTCRNATHILLDEFIVVQKVRKTFAIEMQSKYL